jgi:hypothetical protein
MRDALIRADLRANNLFALCVYGTTYYVSPGGSLRNCLVFGCSATDGGGIYCDGGGTLEHLTVSENSADNAGDGRMDQDELASGFSPYYNEASAIAQGLTD